MDSNNTRSSGKNEKIAIALQHLSLISSEEVLKVSYLIALQTLLVFNTGEAKDI